MNRTLHHPDIGATIVRSHRQAIVLAGSGWVDVTDDNEPARNASTEEWRSHLDNHDLVYAPDASRSDLIDLWDNR